MQLVAFCTNIFSTIRCRVHVEMIMVTHKKRKKSGTSWVVDRRLGRISWPFTLTLTVFPFPLFTNSLCYLQYTYPRLTIYVRILKTFSYGEIWRRDSKYLLRIDQAIGHSALTIIDIFWHWPTRLGWPKVIAFGLYLDCTVRVLKGFRATKARLCYLSIEGYSMG